MLERALIKEVIIENFMSYEYARIPFKPGVNLIIGPNGAGKSSILLAISIALGQTYTERSKALRDLIRRGERVARVTLVLDNSPINGRRPVPRYRVDEIYLTRYLKDDGTYWYEVNGRAVTKTEVVRMLSKLGVNPDNLLIMMHQGMIERFIVLDPAEKLKLVEEAVGLEEYRERILESRRRLSEALSEEEAVKRLLERAEKTLEYWRERYERYLKKKELEERREYLRREYSWAKYHKKVNQLRRIREEIKRVEEEISEVEGEVNELNERIKDLDKEAKDSLSKFEEVLERIAGGKISDEEISELFRLKDSIFSVREEYISAREERAVKKFYLSILEKELSKHKREEGRIEREAFELREEALKCGEEVESERELSEIMDELRLVNAQLASLSDVSEEAEKMYLKYSEVYDELRAKAERVEENRRRALKEVKEREEVWRRKITEVISEVSKNYINILSSLNAVGDVKLINLEEVEEAGLEILVGFRGGKPTILNAYTQSGGERTVATIAFLLALQQYIKSPIRAIDEFDIHTDPVNREMLLKHIFNALSEAGGQYIVITPGRLSKLSEKTHVITVQNVSGKSLVRTVK